MAVPDTTTFTLQDVVDEIDDLPANTLQACFDEAYSDKFDSAYSGSKDRLSNFRNYGAQGGFGLLYNWYTADDGRIAPYPWRVSTRSHWQNLISYAGGINTAGKLKETGTDHWDPNVGATNFAGFKALGGGARGTGFTSLKLEGRYWQANDTGGSTQYFTRFFGSNDNAEIDITTSKQVGMSLRLVYGGTGTAPSTVTDTDGNVYDTVTINGLTWTTTNLKCTTYGSLGGNISIPNVTSQTTWNGLTTQAYCVYDNNNSNI